MSRRTTQIRRLVLGIVGIVAGSHRGLVRHNINGAECAELLRDRCDVIVADEDVLVLFLNQLVTRRHNHFHHILAGGQHWRIEPVGVGCVGIRRTTRAVGPKGLAVCRVYARDTGELIKAVVRCRLYLVPVVHAVIAFELGTVRNRVRRWPAVVAIVHIQVVRLVLQRKVEQIAGGLPGAVHIRETADGVETLRPVVPTGGRGMVHQREGGSHPVRRKPFFVQVYRYVRHVRRPAHVQQELWIVKWARRSVVHFASDAPGLAHGKRLLAELNETVLSGESLPAFARDPRRIDPARAVVDPRGALSPSAVRV